jgi:adenylate cyclase
MTCYSKGPVRGGAERARPATSVSTEGLPIAVVWSVPTLLESPGNNCLPWRRVARKVRAAHPLPYKRSAQGQGRVGKKAASGGGQIRNSPPGSVPAATSATETVAPNPAPPGHGHGHPHIEFKLFEELKHRNVVRVALLYLVACWLILEPTHVVFHMLEVPAWANRLVLILMAIGLPAVLLFAWAFEITPEGLKPTVEVDPRKSIRSLTGRRLDRAILVVLVIALGYFVADKFWLSKHGKAEEQGDIAGASIPAPSSPATAAVLEKSIAVLPFVDMSEKHDQEYFSDGLSEELIDSLARVPDLHVPARTSSFYFKGKQATIADIAKALNVTHLLEGSVRKSGSTLRITVQLVRADNGYHLWSEAYDRKPDDVFKVQDEIANAVVKALKVSLLGDPVPKPKGTGNIEAYNLYLQGRAILLRANSPADFERSTDYLGRALKLDSSFAPAWVWLAVAHVVQAGSTLPVREGFEEARQEVNRALALDPNLSEAHSASGYIHVFYDWDWTSAEVELRKALELDHGNCFAWWHLGYLEEIEGQFAKALQSHQKAVASDPLNPEAYNGLGHVYYRMGDLAQAQAAYHKSRDLAGGSLSNPGFMIGLIKLAGGDAKGALAEADRLKDDEDRLYGEALAYQALGRKAEADQVLAGFEKKFAEQDAYQIAKVHAFRGEIDQAFTWLDRAYRQRESGLPFFGTEPLLKNLRSDPRFTVFMRKMKLPE